MLNYYKILGTAENADQQTIKSAFKKLALEYHPDRKPNNPAAEEYFKLVNEAYQVLSSPEKKKRYDFLLTYSYHQSKEESTTTFSEYESRTRNKTNVYNRYGNQSWRNAPKYKSAPTYKIDRNYYRIQAIMLASILVIGTIIYLFNKYNAYLNEQQEQAKIKLEQKIIEKAQDLYKNGDYREAINLIVTTEQKLPFESKFYNQKNEMVSSLFNSAKNDFNNQSFNTASKKLEVVKDYEPIMKLETWNMLADSYYQLKDYNNAVFALDHILKRDKFNMRLAVKIAKIYKENIHDTTRALEYFDEANLIFKEFKKANFGDAFELVVDPQLLPDFYTDLFMERAKLNISQEHYNEAITDCNWIIFMRPQIAITYAMRASCKFKLGLNERACLDLKRAIERGHIESKIELNKYCI